MSFSEKSTRKYDKGIKIASFASSPVITGILNHARWVFPGIGLNH